MGWSHGDAMTTLFLFGAGASRFSGECIPCPPPLGGELFGALRARGGVAASVDSTLAAAFGDFEAGMALFRSRYEGRTTTLLRETCAYLGEFKLGSRNHYRTLVQGLHDLPDQIVLSTLNYELLLEQAIIEAGMRVAYSGPPAPPRAIVLLKPHGSCNFLPYLPGFSFHNVTFAGGPGATAVDGQVRIVGADEARRFCRDEDSLAPVIAVYARGKQVPFCPSFVGRIQEAWRAAVDSAARLFVIGVRTNPEDAHIWGPLASSTAPLWYVGPDRTAFEAWKKTSGRRNARHLANDFGESLPTILHMLKRVPTRGAWPR